MSTAIDLSGQRFGRLLVLHYSGSCRYGSVWRCGCDCGAIVDVSRHCLRYGFKRSCGCLQRDARRRRMMDEVKTATAVVVNPTHYAVALTYERGMSAPICVAKGLDNIALKIREVAGEHDIPIIENVPLARALYAAVEIDDEIPVEHYHAVAEIIGYVMGLRRGLSGRQQ